MRPPERAASWPAGTLEHTVSRGAIVGVASALPLVAALLVAGASYRGVGWATPMYGVVSALDPAPLFTALDAVARREHPPFLQQPFTAGLATCLMLGAVSGVVFAVGVVRNNIRDRRALALIGPVHGVLMLCVCYLGVLFVLSGLLGSSWVAFSLSHLVGWPTLIGAHLLHGAALALWAIHRGSDAAPPVPSWQRR